MSKKCEKCGRREAIALVTDLNGIRHSYCMDCNNEDTAELLGVENYTDFPREYKATDVDGVQHTFEIVKQIHPMGLLWEANEIGGEYHFALYAEFEDDPDESVQTLLKKIDKGLSKKFIKIQTFQGMEYDSIESDNITARIMYDDEAERVPRMVIDGKSYTWYEFGRMLMGHEGWNVKMKYIEPGLDDD